MAGPLGALRDELSSRSDLSTEIPLFEESCLDLPSCLPAWFRPSLLAYEKRSVLLRRNSSSSALSAPTFDLEEAVRSPLRNKRLNQTGFWRGRGRLSPATISTLEETWAWPAGVTWRRSLVSSSKPFERIPQVMRVSVMRHAPRGDGACFA